MILVFRKSSSSQHVRVHRVKKVFRGDIDTNWSPLWDMKRLFFTDNDVSGSDPHSGGGCNLPEGMKWPLDSEGKPLLHILTIPATWIEARSNLWISIFIPFDTPDSLLHWDLLTASDKNTSTIIAHSNEGAESNKFFDMKSKSKLVQIGATDENEEEFVSKISGNTDWLQGA